MKKIIYVSAIVLIIIIVQQYRFLIYSNIIYIKGNIEINEELKKDIKPDTMLYIIIQNEKDTTFAISEIINPVFPVSFRITRKNVLYPDISTFKIKVYATLNKHGEVGNIKSGDMFSQTSKTYIISNRLKLRIDEVKD
ncbi:MAG: hypothetical protein GX445_06310 [Elusimicrobia bacterium]|nr:hypothetical protein [Elusimicrobiota bacterium]